MTGGFIPESLDNKIGVLVYLSVKVVEAHYRERWDQVLFLEMTFVRVAVEKVGCFFVLNCIEFDILFAAVIGGSAENRLVAAAIMMAVVEDTTVMGHVVNCVMVVSVVDDGKVVVNTVADIVVVDNIDFRLCYPLAVVMYFFLQ
jgi:hypothetical protein